MERQYSEEAKPDGGKNGSFSLHALGLDYGAKTVGCAGTDALGITAQGIEIIRRRSESKLRQTLARIDQLARERGAEVIVLGLPKTLSGRVSDRTYRTLLFRQMVMKRTGLPVILYDERLTTVAADRTMRETGVRDGERKDYVDEIAAMLILQGYIDSVRSTGNVSEVDAEALMAEYEAAHPEMKQG